MTSLWSLVFIIMLAGVNLLIVSSRDYFTFEPRGYGGLMAAFSDESASFFRGSLIYPVKTIDYVLSPSPKIFSAEAFASNQTVISSYIKPSSLKGLPDLRTYFILPAQGWNWGILHYFNAVDIANACGKPIYASAEGLVIEESGNNQWNDGYGNYIFIEHPNGTKTRYAHTLRNIVTVGDYVAQGDQIALIGRTGDTTGCHLHFEVYGAKNPFAIR